MTRYFILTRVPLFILFILFLGTACNNKSDENKVDEQSAGDSIEKGPPVVPPVVQPAANAVGGPLDTLYTDSSTFVNLPKRKMVFRFIYNAEERLTLHGWNNKVISGADQYDTLPILTLLNGNPTDTVIFGPDIYLGNVVIFRPDIQKIWDKLNEKKAKYVIFVPKIVRLKTGKHVGYRIHVGKVIPGLIKVFAAEDTGLEINPSPPKH